MRGEAPFVLSRGAAFIGVMIDDLVTKGITEPYRMLPSRAEYRISLHEGNADLRLARIGYEIGLLDAARYEKVEQRRRRIERLLDELKATRVGPRHRVNERLIARGTSPLDQNGASLYELLRRPQVRLSDLIDDSTIPDDVKDEVVIAAKYEGYLAQQAREIAHLKKMDEGTKKETGCFFLWRIQLVSATLVIGGQKGTVPFFSSSPLFLFLYFSSVI